MTFIRHLAFGKQTSQTDFCHYPLICPSYHTRIAIPYVWYWYVFYMTHSNGIHFYRPDTSDIIHNKTSWWKSLYRTLLSILYEYPIWRTVIYCQNNDLLYVTQNRIVRISVCHMKSVSFDLTWLPFILYACKTYKCWLILINVYDLPVWITYITHSYGTPPYSAIPLFHIPIIT